MFGKKIGGEKQHLRKKHCFNVPNIVPTFVPIGNYCPIIFVKGEANRDCGIQKKTWYPKKMVGLEGD
jgi:hypothetical protein